MPSGLSGGSKLRREIGKSGGPSRTIRSGSRESFRRRLNTAGANLPLTGAAALLADGPRRPPADELATTADRAAADRKSW